jgi:hypothetical protein
MLIWCISPEALKRLRERNEQNEKEAVSEQGQPLHPEEVLARGPEVVSPDAQSEVSPEGESNGGASKAAS